MSCYRFNPELEPPVMLIQVQPHRYVAISDKTDTKVPGTSYFPTSQVVLRADGKKVRKFDFGTAEVWVPTRIGNNLIESTDGTGPVAKMIASRTEQEANDDVDPRQLKKKRRRKAVVVDEEIESDDE